MAASPPRERRRVGLLGLLTAEAISVTGSRMSLVAVPWLVLGTTGDPALAGVVAAAETLAYVLTGALGATLIDRLGARRASIAADLLSVVALGPVPLVHQHGIGVLLALVTLAGALRGFGDLAKRVVLPVAVADSGVAMARATALHDGVARLSALAGGLGAGVLVAWLGAPAVIALDAASFAVGALVLAVTVPGTRKAPKATAERAEPYLAALRGGLRHLRGDRLILSVVALMFAINLFDNAALAVLIPVWAQQVAGSPVAIGLFSAAFALGAVTGNVVLAALSRRVPRYATLAAGLLVGGAPRFFALGASDSMAVVTAVMFAAGIGLASANPVIATVMYERIPEALHARVFGVATAVAYAGMPLGSLLGGLAVPALGFTAAATLTGTLCLAVTVVPLLARRTWRQLDQPGDTAATGAAAGATPSARPGR